MGKILLQADDKYSEYMNNVRFLVDPALDDEQLPNTLIDSIAYMQSIEDDLLTHIEDATNQNHAKRNMIVKYVIFGTAIELRYKYAQILQETELDEATRFEQIGFDKDIDNLNSRFGKVSEDLGIPINARGVNVVFDTI